MEVLDSDILPFVPGDVSVTEGPQAFSFTDDKPEKTSENPSIKALADKINFLIKVAFSFRNREDFLKQIQNFIFQSISKDKNDPADQPKLTLWWSIDDVRKKAPKGREPLRDDEKVRNALPRGSSVPVFHAINELIETISSMELFLRAYLCDTKTSSNGNSFEGRLMDIILHFPLLSNLPSTSLDTFKLGLRNHFIRKGLTKPMPPLEEFCVTYSFLKDLLDRCKAPSSIVVDPIPLDLKAGELADRMVQSCVSIAQGPNAQLPASDSPRTKAPEKTNIEHQKIRDSLESKAPQCCGAIKNLIALSHHQDSKSIVPFDPQVLIQDLVPKPMPDFPSSFTGFMELVLLIQSNVENARELDTLAAGMELNFLKSSTRNADWWKVIGKTSASPSSPENQKWFQTLSGPYIRSEDIQFIPSPTPADVEALARAMLILEPGDLPKGLVQEVLKKFPNQLDLRKAELFMQDFLSQRDRVVLSRSIRHHISLVLSDKGDSESFAQKIHDDTLGYVQNNNVLIREYVRNHELVRKLSRFEHSKKPQDCFENDHERIFENLKLLVPGLFRDEAPFALSDIEFNRLYTSSIRCNPSRNFDTAQLGITNQDLVEAADEWLRSVHDREPNPFPYILDYSRTILLNSLFPKRSGGVPAGYPPENLIFSQSGSTAFDLISSLILPKADDHILTSSEEYDSFIKLQNLRETLCTPLDSIKGRSEDEMKMELMKKLKADKNIRFVLVSDITRRGTMMPLKIFVWAREALASEGRPLFLIVDGCQSFGRKPFDFQAIRPDAFFVSGIKVADTGQGGFALVSKAIADFRGRRVLDCGSQIEQIMARLLLASDPRALLVSDRDDILDPTQRQVALRDLSFKFVSLLDKLIPKGRFEILRPSHLYRDSSQNPIQDQLAGLFECKIQGFSRDKVAEIAQRFGLHIASSYDDPIESVNSFRIALHPRMGNQSVLLLAYVLYLITEMKRLNLSSVEDCHKLLLKSMPPKSKAA